MFNFIKEKIKKVYSSFTSALQGIFSRTTFDEAFLQELRVLLLSADTGVKTTEEIIAALTRMIKDERLSDGHTIKGSLEKILLERLQSAPKSDDMPAVLLMVGVNGSGKTTFVGKLAHHLQRKGKRVLLVAGDTFRAAATQQLGAWGARIGVEVFQGKPDQDPAAVIYDACEYFKQHSFDHIIIDTAGRLQTKVNLMKELEKIRKVVGRQLPSHEVSSWLTLDAMLGQNALAQAEVFHEVTQLNGIVLTKMDGTGKGGVVFAVVEKFKLPILYMTYGEQVDALKHFDPVDYVHGLLYE